MYTLIVENSQKEILELTHNAENYSVTHVSGLLPPQNSILLSNSGFEDGAMFNAAHVETRNIVITVYLNGDIAANRQRLYRMFPYKSPVTIYFSSKNRNVKIDGWTELIDGDPFSMRESVQISVICPQPYWEALQDMREEISRSTAGFEFPFSISEEGIAFSGICPHPVSEFVYTGDTTVGLTAEIRIADAEPDITTTETRSLPPGTIMGKRVLFPLGNGFDYDPSATPQQYLEISVNGTARTDYTTKFMTHENQARDLYLTFNSAVLSAGNAVKAVVYTLQTVPDYQTFDATSGTSTVSGGVAAFYSKPDWYTAGDTTTEIHMYDADDSSEITGLCTLSVTENNLIRVDCSSYVQYIRITMVKPNGSHQERVILCEKTVIVAAPQEVFFASVSYTAYDLVRVYMGDQKLSGWQMETVRFSDGTQQLCLHLGTAMTGVVTVQVVSSISGEDIHDYTDTQVDAALKLVDTLTFSNVTYGEKMIFSHVRFHPGDVLELSTVSGSIYVKCVESTWMEPGENLLYALSGESVFPKIRPGKNRISVTAATNQDLISGYLTAKKLFGGV